MVGLLGRSLNDVRQRMHFLTLGVQPWTAEGRSEIVGALDWNWNNVLQFIDLLKNTWQVVSDCREVRLLGL